MLKNQRHLFSIPDEVSYLNCSYMSPLLKSSIAAGTEGLAQKSKPWKISSEDFFSLPEEVKNLAGKLINTSSDNIALHPSVSYGIELAAKNIEVLENQKIVVLENQFPSNIYPWHKKAQKSGGEVLEVAKIPGLSWTESLLIIIDKYKWEISLIALPHCHWVDGTTIQLQSISLECKKYDIKLIIDTTQSLGVMPFDIEEIKPDFMVTACYKWLLGPYSVAFSYISPKYHGGVPIEEHWSNRANAYDFSKLCNYTDKYLTGAKRFDVGESSNFALLPVAKEALKQILDWKEPLINATIENKSNLLIKKLEAVGFLFELNKDQSPHILAVPIPESISFNKLKDGLNKFNVHLSLREGNLRISPYLYNTENDLDLLIKALEFSRK